MFKERRNFNASEFIRWMLAYIFTHEHTHTHARTHVSTHVMNRNVSVETRDEREGMHNNTRFNNEDGGKIGTEEN